MKAYEKIAFEQACADATPAVSIFLSLYARIPYYGGPEEGGWWGEDVRLVAYKEFRTEAEAEAAEAQVRELAKKLDWQAQRHFGESCQDQLDWCEARGIDDANSVFGEVDGATSYWVTQESRPGSHESDGMRHYE